METTSTKNIDRWKHWNGRPFKARTRILPARQAVWLAPWSLRDPSDRKRTHLDGLDVSRAWILDHIVAGLPKKRAAPADGIGGDREAQQVRGAGGANFPALLF